MPEALFSKRGGYRRLDTFMLATVIYYATVEFCRAHVKSSRQIDQMVQAARSGRQNIAEGSERSSTSTETEIRLTDVARASLAELQLDYEDFLNLSGRHPWSEDDPACKAVWAVRLERLPHDHYGAHHFSKLVAENRERFSRWLNPQDPFTMANALISLCDRADWLLRKQIDALGSRFSQEGGFKEKMTRVRIEARNLPECPQCGKPMRKRVAKKGGDSFWGCAAYPECTGTRPCDRKDGKNCEA